MPFPPTGTVTFLFTDIEGSTKLWEQHPDAMRLALARHDDLLRQSIEDADGFVFKTVGDAFCAAFSTAGHALEAALAAQLALAGGGWELPVRVRMALHTGACDERGGDYFGQPLNRVARLIAAGYGGQTLLSGVTQRLIWDALPPQASLRDLGQRRLKDLGRPEQVFQLLHPSLPADFPPLRSLDNPDLPNNLPPQVTTFVGREAQVAEVTSLLARTRLLTLTGAGGSGKTRLSLQVAADLLDRYFDGVWLVELAALSDPALVPQAIADMLGVREEPDQPLTRTLAEELKAKRLLLVLDNCEHLVAACATLATDLLRFCPDVRILATSREPLGVAGEQTYRVPSLSLPDPKKVQTVESLSQFEAVRLFLERAQTVQPSFAVTDANAPAVAQVCWRLDGIPLALELAAARVRSLPVEQINTRLDRRFRLLTGGARDTLPRQQTLQALVDWSYDLLTEHEKTLLRRLSVFAGGWTLPAAEAVVGFDPVKEWEVLDVLTGLVDKSLAVYEEEEDRYRLLETIRQYAGERLTEREEADQVQERMAVWFRGMAEEAEPQFRGPKVASWLERLEVEHDNLRASLSWYEHSSEGVESGLRLAGALARFWWMRGHYGEGRLWLGRVLEASAGLGASAARAKALSGAGFLTREQGDYAEAQALYEQSLTIYRQLGDQHGIAHILNSLGGVDLEQGDYAAARTWYEEGLTLSRQLEDQPTITYALGGLGVAAFREGDYAKAQALFGEILAIFRQSGDLDGINTYTHNLGEVAWRQGDYAAARTLYEESLTLSRRLEYKIFYAMNLEGLARVASSQSDPSRAVRLLGAAAAIHEATASPLPPVDQEEIDEMLTALRAALGEISFASSWTAGRSLTMEKAVEYALSPEA